VLAFSSKSFRKTIYAFSADYVFWWLQKEGLGLLRSRFAKPFFRKSSSGSRDAKAQSESNGPLLLGKLAEAKKAAFRRGVWFRALNRIERGIVDLTMRYVDNIKSAKLAKVLTAIIEKLQQATESMADRLVRNIGIPLAQKISGIAVSWGNHAAAKWAQDRSFARFLVLCISKT
jgi:hypothetical protein